MFNPLLNDYVILSDLARQSLPEQTLNPKWISTFQNLSFFLVSCKLKLM